MIGYRRYSASFVVFDLHGVWSCVPRPLKWAFLSAVLLTGCTAQSPSSYDPERARAAIAASLPTGWSVEPPSQQQSERTDAYFNDPRVVPILILGPRPYAVTATDRQGQHQQVELGRECLWLWLVPGDFTPRFPSRFNPAAVEPPDQIFASKVLRAYGMENYRKDPRLPENAALFRDAASISDPKVDLSWKTWKTDLATRLSDLASVISREQQVTAAHAARS